MRESDINMAISLLEQLLEETEKLTFTITKNDGDAFCYSLDDEQTEDIKNALFTLRHIKL